MWRIPSTIVLLLSSTGSAFAYIGPGVGAGMIATVVGILTAIALAMFALLWYPLKRLLKPKHGRNKN